MSESFSADRSPVSIREVPFKSLKPSTEPVRPATPAPLEQSVEQARAVKGALNFLAALIAFYGELIERDGLTDDGLAGGGRARAGTLE